MKVQIKFTKEVEIKAIFVKARVRYWEDATVNGVEDVEGNLIPCREGDLWCPQVRVSDGRIFNWTEVTANIHYKVVDQCSFSFIDENGDEVFAQENDGVPDFLCPKENGYGDYIIMDVVDGFIQDWNPDLQEILDDRQ